jgi:hypothetical protein
MESKLKPDENLDVLCRGCVDQRVESFERVGNRFLEEDVTASFDTSERGRRVQTRRVGHDRERRVFVAKGIAQFRVRLDGTRWLEGKCSHPRVDDRPFVDPKAVEVGEVPAADGAVSDQ